MIYAYIIFFSGYHNNVIILYIYNTLLAAAVELRETYVVK
jgi:hypothetical protein